VSIGLGVLLELRSEPSRSPEQPHAAEPSWRFADGRPAHPYGPRDAERAIIRLRGAPSTLAVVWRTGDAELATGQGLILWRRAADSWRAVYSRRLNRRKYAHARIYKADLTGDGRQDVLLEEDQGGTAACGTWRVLAPEAAGVRQVFRRSSCETWYTARNGTLLVNEPVGPCPQTGGAIHCFGGRRLHRLKWNGERFERTSTRVTCYRDNLDPRNQCRRRQA